MEQHIRMDDVSFRTPCYIVQEKKLRSNLQILRNVAEESGAHILLAQKAFSMYHYYPVVAEYLAGATASGLHEAKLGAEEMGRENHIFSPAYREDEFDEITHLCDHIIFNSFSQWDRYKEKALLVGCSCGIRVNPECSTQDHGIYEIGRAHV